jgi:hypothetical protein
LLGFCSGGKEGKQKQRGGNINVILMNYPKIELLYNTKKCVCHNQVPKKGNLRADMTFVFLIQSLARAAAMEQHNHRVVVILESHP